LQWIKLCELFWIEKIF